MELNFVNPGVEYMINSIMEFQEDKIGTYWSDSLFYFYPSLDKEVLRKMEKTERKNYIENALRMEYKEIESVIADKIKQYEQQWRKCEEQITAALSEAFEIDCKNAFGNMTCRVSMNPICPRYLEEQVFDVFYLNSERGAIGMAIHEIIHFVWFYVWNTHFKDNAKEYEIPHLKWILSEMTVEPIMRDERLATINPYFHYDYEQKQGGCVYECFYEMKIEGKPILDTLYEMYQNYGITGYMEQAYGFCQTYEKEIRDQMNGVC